MSTRTADEEAQVTRQSQILEMVMEADRIEVTELADRIGVSSVTIRKDLDQLVSRGLVRREHGYALAASPDDLTSHLEVHYEV
jgi:DeoR/GlpR family transcriptional regulator of sugar metabolism